MPTLQTPAEQKDHISAIHEHKKTAPPEAQVKLHDQLVSLLTEGHPKKMAWIIHAINQQASQATPGTFTLLDIGCGCGALSLYMGLLGLRVIAIDMDEAALGHGKALAGHLGLAETVRFMVMDACNITESGFDMAVSTDFYEHITDEAQMRHLTSVHSALNTGGMYVIRSPHRKNVRQHRGDHIGLPSFGRLEKQSRQAGFDVSFSIAHTTLTSPVNYHVAVERLIEGANCKPELCYKLLQKFGLANVLARLHKVT